MLSFAVDNIKLYIHLPFSRKSIVKGPFMYQNPDCMTFVIDRCDNNIFFTGKSVFKIFNL